MNIEEQIAYSKLFHKNNNKILGGKDEMELQDVLEKRRSIRKYKDKEVSDEDIRLLIQAAILAPSWKNSQVTRYYVVKSAEMLKSIKETLPEFNQQNVKDAPVLIISTIVLNRSGFDRDGTPSNELGNGWGCYDCGLHNMNILLKATELGLSTLVMGLRDEKNIRRLLKIPDNEKVISVIGLGYGDIEPEMPKRKHVDDIMKMF